MTTTDTGVAIETPLGADDDGSEAFLARFMPEGDPDAPKKKEPSEEGKPEKTETQPEPEETEETSDESPEETEETDEDQEEPKRKFAADDDETYVKIKQGDEEHEVPVKDLKRLWGQEASLTRKSQEVAALRQKHEAETTKVVESYSKLLQHAKQRLEPYQKIDFLVASKELSAEDLQALRAEAKARWDDVQFLEQELNGHVQQIAQQRQTEIAEQAKACIKALSDPESSFHIPEWGDKVYGELRDFATGQGLSKDIFNQLVDPAAIKLLHMARQYHIGKSKVVTQKVNKTPKKIIKSTRSPESTKPDKAKADKAMSKLKQTGTTEDAAEVLLARFMERSGDE